MKPEEIEHIKLMDWIRSKKELAQYTIHVANERATSPAQGAKLKRMGVRSGVSDLFIGVPKGDYNGMWLELKAGKNKPTDNQFKFMEDMSSQGYYCVWCSGFPDAKMLIEDYLKKPSLK